MNLHLPPDSLFQDFAFTAKKVTKKTESATVKDYEDYMTEMTNKYCVKFTNVNYERDKQYDRLHVHAIITVPKHFFRNKLQRKGWTVDLKEITNRQGWIAYVEKEQANKKQPKKTPTQSLFKTVKRTYSDPSTQTDTHDYDLWRSEMHSYEFPSDEYIIPV